MKGKLISPFTIADSDVAYAAYCKMPHLSAHPQSKLTKSAFKKKHAIEYPKRQDAPVSRVQAEIDLSQFTPEVATQIAESLGLDYTPVVVNPLIQQLRDAGVDEATIAIVAATEGITEEVVEDTTVYRERTSRDLVPDNVARNTVLWALNTEGFLQIAPEGGCDPIRQEAGTGLLSETFGPQK